MNSWAGRTIELSHVSSDMKCRENRILKQLQIDIEVSVFPQDLNQLQQHRQLIASGQIGQPVDHVLKPVMVDAKNTQDIKR